MNMRRKTKIVCTLGPSTESEDIIKQLMIEGMDVARFNFSHGTYDDKLNMLDKVKKIRQELKLPVATLLDTKGPEIRIGTFKEGKITLETGTEFTLTTNEIEGDEKKVTISYKELVNDVKIGGRILIDDGLIELKITNVTKTDIVCRVINGGVISNRKGVNVPNVEVGMPFISEKDYEDIMFGIKNDFDFIAASFTRTADDVMQIRKILEAKGGSDIAIIAKIESRQGVENIDDIIKVADGVMVARGDMGVEIPLEEVPAIQKVMIKKVYSAGKQVITATQMLDSMMKNPRPTRAEATDVANAIYDGTSAIMLSGETAAGLYPVESVKTMAKIAVKTEQDINYSLRFKQKKIDAEDNITNAISHATCTTAEDLKVAGIITVTKTGFTAKMISKYRPSGLIVGCSTYEKVCRQLNLVWGVAPLLIKEERNTDTLFDHAVDAAEAAGYIKAGELTVITAGIPLGVSGTTNLIKVHVAGHVLVKGYGVSGTKARGRLCVCKNKDDVKRMFKPGDIIVIPDSSNAILPQIKEACGLITESKDGESHGAIVGLTLDMPVVIGASHATQILKSGAVVTVDAKKGVVISN